MPNGFTRKSVQFEKTLGQRLKIARRRKKISLDEAELQTKVRAKYLSALEKDDYTTLPSNVYTQGFLLRYANFLKVPEQEILKLYKQEWGIRSKIRRAPQEEAVLVPQRHLKGLRVLITPRLLAIIGVVLVVGSLLTYIFVQVRRFSAPPPLEISTPAAEAVVTANTVQVVGSTEPGASLFINNQSVNLDENGKFNQPVKLEQGVNTIEVLSRNRAQKQTIKTLKILANF